MDEIVQWDTWVGTCPECNYTQLWRAPDNKGVRLGTQGPCLKCGIKLTYLGDLGLVRDNPPCELEVNVTHYNVDVKIDNSWHYS